MAQKKRFRLLIYENILNRWIPAVFTIGFVLFLFVGVLWGFEWYYINPLENPLPTLPEITGIVLLVAGGLSLLLTFFLIFARKNAAVQLYANYFKISTPFLRLNIPYKRINRIQTAEFASLFPPSKLSEWEKEMIMPLASQTAIIVHLNSMPMAQKTLRLFLSRYFFIDSTPHLVLLVDDWLTFSTKFESARTTGKLPSQIQKTKSPYGILDSLKK